MQWRDEFNAEFFFLHSTSNSCRVLIAFLGTNKVTVEKEISDTEGRFLILDIEIASQSFIFINLLQCKHGIQYIYIYIFKEARGSESGSGLWKFNNSLLQDENFVKEL